MDEFICLMFSEGLSVYFDGTFKGCLTFFMLANRVSFSD